MSAILGCLGLALVGVGARAQPTARIDLRILAGGGVFARPTDHAGDGAGVPVRLVSYDGAACDGTLGAYAQTAVQNVEGETSMALAAPVRGSCAGGGGSLFAILRPAPTSTWPAARPATDPRAAGAIEAARAAAATAGHLRGEIDWETPRVYELGTSLYALVSGPACGEDEMGCSPTVAALARVEGGGTAEVVLARPAHWLWTHEELMDASFSWRGVVDVDGDGAVEVIETLMGESAFMIRLVRVGARPAGDVVWLASYRDDVLGATVGRAPRPVAPAMR